MVTELVRHIIPHYGYWRMASFGEMAQLYAARLLRMVSQNMVSVFVAIFMYQKGYSLESIMLIICGYYVLRAIVSFFTAYYVAWVGPKRAIMVSNLLAVPSLVALTTIDEHTVASVVVYFVFQAVALTVFTIASDVQFSSLKSSNHAGKEVGRFHVMEKIGMGLAPMIGGFVAYLMGPEYTMWVAAILSIFSALPLFLTPERFRRHQRVTYQGMPIRLLRSQLMSITILGADQVVSGATWALFAGIMVFGIQSNEVYAQLGVAFSVSLVVSIIISQIFGKIIDRRRGRELMVAGMFANAAVHVSRCFVTTPFGVMATNATNEIGTSAYQMPYIRSYIDQADTIAGYRAVYISLMMVMFSLGAALLSALTSGAIWLFGPAWGLIASFLIMAVATFGTYWNGFDTLRAR